MFISSVSLKAEVFCVPPDFYMADLVHWLHAHDDYCLIVSQPAEEIAVCGVLHDLLYITIVPPPIP